MGNGASSSGTSGVEDAEIQRQKKERQKAFDTYNQQQKSSRKSERETGMALPVSRPTQAVRSNIQLAQELEGRATSEDFTGQKRGNKILNMREAMFPMGRALSFARTLSFRQQAGELRKGGNAVFDREGQYRGVVRDGRFSGESAYSPIGRSTGVSFDSASGRYTTEALQDVAGSDNESESGNVGTARSQIQTENKTDSTATGVSAAARRGLLSQGGGARRRLLLG
mgnify:CR=1 FL=1